MSATLYKISEAAKLIGLSRQRLYLYIADGRLKTVEAHGMVMVTAAEVAKFTRGRNGRPNGKPKGKK